MRKFTNPLMSLSLVGLLGGLFGGCAQDVGDIDRTQNNIVRKSVYVGDPLDPTDDPEFYYKQTIVDAPYSTPYAFAGEEGGLDRIRWHISEGYLTAYRTYEFAEGTEAQFDLTGEQYVGSPVAQFRIQSHFDIQRGYNSATGEQTNVISENASDRLWYEREFMRVDWSTSTLVNFNFVNDASKGSPTDYFIEDPNHPDRPMMATKSDACEGDAFRTADGWCEYRPVGTNFRELHSADYFDVVTRMFVGPDTYGAWDPEGGPWSVPGCLLYQYYPSYVSGPIDCAGAEVKLRHSFLKVETREPYVSLDYPDNTEVRDADGARILYKWNDRRGRYVKCTDEDSPSDCFEVKIPMFDKFGYFRTERDAYSRERGFTEHARIYKINRHNIWKDEAGCKKEGAQYPYEDCEINPIVYYMSPDFPAHLQAAANQVVAEWNEAFQETARELTGKHDEDFQVFVLKTNTRTVDGTGNVVDPGQKIGDLRYNHLYWLAQPGTPFLGYGPSSADPLTGEIVVANAYVGGAGIETYATYALDIIDLLVGNVTLDDFVDGEITASKVVNDYDDLTAPGVDQATWDAMARGDQPMNEHGEYRRTMADVQAFMANDFDRDRVQTLKNLGSAMGGTDGALDLLKADYDVVSQRLSKLSQAPWLEDMLINDEIKIANGIDPDAVITDEMREKLSPRNWTQKTTKEYSEWVDKLSRHNIYHASFADDAVIGLARALAQYNYDRPTMLHILQEKIFLAVMEHEVGHTLGLRHNFEGSYDALNYHDEFWVLKGEESPFLSGQTWDQAHGHAVVNGEDRWFSSGMREFQYSTTMDYGSNFNSDVHGLGKYDRAAIKFGYGQLVEVFENAPKATDDHRLLIWPLQYVARNLTHYTNLPKLFGGVENMEHRRNVPYSQIVAQLTFEEDESLTEVPYMFCSDEYAGGTPTCQRWDMGADPYEIARKSIDDYRNYYYFNSFKRDRRFFGPDSYMGRVYSRYFDNIVRMYQHWVFGTFSSAADAWYTMSYYNGRATCDDGGTPDDPADDALCDFGLQSDEWNLDENGGASFVAATMDGLNALVQVLGTPEPGQYIERDIFKDGEPMLSNLTWEEDYLRMCGPGEDSIVNGSLECADAVIPLGIGRYPYTNYDGTSGYYFFDRIKWVGSFYDKVAATLALVNPETNFVGVDTASDIRRYSIPFYLMFPKIMTSVFGGVVSDEYARFAPVLADDGKVSEFKVFPSLAATNADSLEGDATLENGHDGVTIDPGTGFTIQLYALLYSMAFFPSTWDQTYNDNMQVWMKGDEIPNIDPDLIVGAGLQEFVNPFNGRVYQSLEAQDTTGLFGVGGHLIARANHFKEQYELRKALYDANPTNETRRIDFENSEFRLQNHIENLEIVRGMYRVFGYNF